MREKVEKESGEQSREENQRDKIKKLSEKLRSGLRKWREKAIQELRGKKRRQRVQREGKRSKGERK